MLTDEYGRIPLDEVVVKRDERQRTTVEVEDLLPSVRRFGVMKPILIDRQKVLIAGERRLEASRQAALPDIPFRYVEDLRPLERQLLEHEENAKRKNLPWQDLARTIERIHLIHLELDPEWTVEKTALDMGYTERHTVRMIDLAEAIKAEDKTIIESPTYSQAYTILERRRQRAADAAVNRILENDRGDTPQEPDLREPDGEYDGSPTEPDTGPTVVVKDSQVAAVSPRPAFEPPFYIIEKDAKDFFSRPGQGKLKYNFLHVDFPYGVELNEQAGQDAFEGGGYDSTADIYWELLDAMAAGWDSFMLPSAHVMFWISMEFYTETLDFFDKRLPQIKMQRTPLIWMKTDGKGIIPDAKRQPRRTYEAALFGSTSDRFIVKPVANAYGAPTDKSNSIHTNEKPIPMLKHFFSMFIDEHTRILDPTCGSGSAIRAAEAMGAERGLGLECNPDFAARAQQRLITERNLRLASEKING